MREFLQFVIDDPLSAAAVFAGIWIIAITFDRKIRGVEAKEK